MNADACIVCGEPKGANPKFCGRSCAAKYNNTIRPKRKAGGACARCGMTMPKGKTYCESCRPLVQAEKQREADQKSANIRRWSTSGGEFCEAPIRRMHVSKKVVFRADTGGRELLNSKTLAGELLDRLVGICFANPAYLRSDAAARYVALLNELRDFQLEPDSTTRFSGRKVAELPLEWLSLGLGAWVLSYFHSACYPLMPCYALDAARLLQFHADGYYGHSPESWCLERMVAESREDRDLFRFLSPQFKKEFTENLGRVFVLARVPEGARLDYCNEAIAEGADTVLFSFKRCYLSESWGDYYGLEVSFSDPAAPRFDLMAEFCFIGDYLLTSADGRFFRSSSTDVAEGLIRSVQAFQSAQAVRGIRGTLPAQWVTDVVQFDPLDRSSPAKLLPVPVYQAELDERSLV